MKHPICLALLALSIQLLPAHAQTVPPMQTAEQREDDSDTLKLQLAYRNGLSPGMGAEPYSAEMVNERTRKLADGNQIVTRDTELQYRDRNGRTRVTYKSLQGRERTIVVDPQRLVGYMIRPERKDVLRVMGAPSPLRSLLSRNIAFTEPPWSKEVKTRLGVKAFHGLKSYGILTETHIPPGARDNEKEIVETMESWHAPVVQMVVYRRTNSPMHGEHVMRFQHLTAGDQPEELFALPKDYAVREVLLERAPALERK